MPFKQVSTSKFSPFFVFYLLFFVFDLIFEVPPLFFCEMLAQLFFAALFFNSCFLGLSAAVLEVSGLQLSLSWSLDNRPSLEGLVWFAAVIRIDGFVIDGPGVGSWI